ncbi:amidohydrolase [Nocardioides sp. CBS4Y-1]|uniref:2-amino-3-carboxymuconate-6-semialdehyde decarboxylase n=1 Tax=Nocardioides acrostichi TaxID=2784339 RepID=A0A930V2J9_9ACTN|nr:amidohydrolase [Nocardioides acrostichi]
MRTDVISEAPGIVVDAHAHILPAGLPAPDGSDDPRWPRLVRHDASHGSIMLGDREFRPVRSALWDVRDRLAELDASGIDVQLVSPVPITLTDWAPAPAASAFAAAMNDGIAAAVAESGGRLVGLGALPVQDVDAAVAELERIVTTLGLRGAEIGCRLADRELDDPAVRALFDAAEALGAILYVHPLGGGDGALRRTGQPYDFGLGMLSDTALAAGALVFGGVLRDHPALKVVMSHGCGTFPFALPRLALGAALFQDPATDHDDLARRLWVDTLVFDHEHVRLLVRRFGADHIVMGTDHPFIAGQLEAQPLLVRAAVDAGILTDEQGHDVRGANAAALLGLAAGAVPRGGVRVDA